MHPASCPPQLHFHVVFEQVGSISRPKKTVISPTPADALDDFLKLLPGGWRGGVSIYDDEIGHEDEMPILHLPGSHSRRNQSLAREFLPSTIFHSAHALHTNQR